MVSKIHDHGLAYKVYVKAIHVCIFVVVNVVQVVKPMTIEFHQLLGQGFSHGVHGPSWRGIHGCKLWPHGGG